MTDFLTSEIRRPGPEELADCLTYPSKIIETSKGPMEYAIRGQGPALLCVHGGPGGYDQGLGLGEFFRVNGFTVIAPSRPGYLGTPLATGGTLEEQADALAAFLEALGIKEIMVIGASAGGPPTYLLAAKHPNKVSALMEIDSVCLTYKPDVSPLQEKLFLSRLGVWMTRFFLNHFPKTTVKGFLQSESSLEPRKISEITKHIMGDESKLAFLKFLIATMSQDFDKRQAGVHNDLTQMAAIEQLPLARVACPTLIFHGTEDKDVLPSHGEYAYATISNSEIYRIQDGDHVGFWIGDEAQAAHDYALAWLREKSAG